MKMKTKKKLVRLLSSLMIVFAVLNLVGIILGFGNKSNAADGFTLAVDGALVASAFATGGLSIVIIFVIKIAIIVLGVILQAIMSGAYSTLESNLQWAGLGSIIFAGAKGEGFKGSKFLDINFFDLSLADGPLLTFRTAVAKWYYILRLISAAILLVILIYVGIKMAISTIASEQAKYKQMLVDWVASLALLFLLHYVIIFAITVNSTLVGALAKSVSDPTEGMLGTLTARAILSGVEGLFAAGVYLIMVGQIFSFFLLYMKRMVTVGFLIMIAPLITVTYAIDKMGDGKAQALNAWLKELVYNILIQPFHCVLFLAFFDAVAKIIKGDNFSIGAYIFAIVIIKFMKKAEDILRKIFHFEASSMSSISESGQNIANATGKFVGMGMKAGGALAMFKAAGGWKGARDKFQDFRANERARKQLKQYYKDDIAGKNGPPSIKATSFKDYANSVEGKQKLGAIKQSNAAQMAVKAEQNRTKRQERKEEKVKQKAEAQLRAEMGDAAYETLKARADGGDKNAQKVITDKENKVRENSFPKRTIKGISNVASTASEGVKRFAASDYGKLVGAAAKDSMKVAAAIGMASFAVGATGELNDAISLGQTGYGFAKGFLQNSTKTLVDNSAEKAEQLAALQGVDPSDTEALQKILAGVTAEKNAGALETKSISNQLDKLEDAITSLFADRATGNLEASLFVNAIQSASVKGELNPAEIERLIEQQFDKMDESDKADIQVEASKYAQIILKAGIATNGTTFESSGRDVDEHDAKVVEKVVSRN